MTVAQARTEIETFLQASAFPALTSTELDLLVGKAKRASQPFTAGVLTGSPILNQAPLIKPGSIPPDSFKEWVAATVYTVGQTVVPTPRNGHYYTVQTGGTSGATQPNFPTTTGGTVNDNGIIWVESGQALWVPTFNLAYAIALGFDMKAAKVAAAYDFKSDDQSLSRSQMIEHFQALAKTWRAKSAETLTLQGAGRVRGNLNSVLTANLDDDRWCECGNSFGCGSCRGWAIPGSVHYVCD